MMELQTTVDIPKGKFSIGHDDRIMLLGSCFADEIGGKLIQYGFRSLVNPFGTIYNPASLAAILLRCISLTPYSPTSRELFCDSDGVWHSWMHHSRFSSQEQAELIAALNDKTNEASEFLKSADVLIVTLGTAIIYRLKESGLLVSNCHKQPDAMFRRERLTVYDIVDQWRMLLPLLRSVNPRLKVIFTVSPIRHKRDGMHINQISKGILLQAVDELLTVAGEDGNSYFPSYELMMDELRDYRFYANDMIHPSPVAVEYIWQRFQDTYMTPATRQAGLAALKEWKRSQHREIIGAKD